MSFLDFRGNAEAVRKAVDEIIKFNGFTLEFNYMHELFTHLQKLALARTGSLDWGGLFSHYDKNRDNLFDKNELREMMLDCGAEVVKNAKGEEER